MLGGSTRSLTFRWTNSTRTAASSAYAAEQCAGDFATCPAVTYVVGSGSSSQLELAQGIAAQWRQAFPGWAIEAIEAIVWSGSADPKLFSYLQLSWDGWGVDYPDPQDFLSVLWATHASYNQSHVSVSQAEPCERIPGGRSNGAGGRHE
jgi:hypothetical protein